MNKRRLMLLAAVLLASVTGGGCGYNTLTTKQQAVRAKWAGVESQLQRRADLIPNLVAAAQSVGVQEQEVFGQIAEARSRLLNATGAQPQGEAGDKSPEQKQAIIEANNSFGGTIGRLLSLQENYPVLQSNQNFLKLQDELTGTENRLAVARDDYTASAQDYNTARGQFPMVIAAKMYGFKEEPYFKADEGSRQVPRFDPNTMRRNQAPQPQGGATTNAR